MKLLSSTRTGEVIFWIAVEFLVILIKKNTAVAQTQLILHKIDHLKIDKFLNHEEVCFLVTRVFWTQVLVMHGVFEYALN